VPRSVLVLNIQLFAFNLLKFIIDINIDELKENFGPPKKEPLIFTILDLIKNTISDLIKNTIINPFSIKKN